MADLFEMTVAEHEACFAPLTAEQAQDRYRTLARVLHPDANPDRREDATRAFVRLGQAHGQYLRGRRRD